MAEDLIDRMTRRANQLYAERKIPAEMLAYRAPETWPMLQSDQVKSLLQTCAEEIERAQLRIATLEFENAKREDNGG